MHSAQPTAFRPSLYLYSHRLRFLASEQGIPEVPPLPAEADSALERITNGFDLAAASRVKAIEGATNHDVKAIEYWLKEQFVSPAGHPALRSASEFVHFAATSEDVSNCAYALLVAEARATVLLPAMRALVDAVATSAEELAAAPLLSRTHGQAATPTTMGKELANFAVRLSAAGAAVAAVAPRGKWSGAVGNFNAQRAAYPDVDWPAAAARFVRGRLGLAYAPFCTQIEPHDWLAELAHALQRFNAVLLGLDRDAWGYISRGYFTQRTVAGEVGSSTMPHKVNPIDFENSEGNLGVASAALSHLAEKLPVSRFQRDLSDSTVLRTLGASLGHCLLAYAATRKGLGKLRPDVAAMREELDAHAEVLAEPIQTVMRRYGVPAPYERLRDLTRGRGAFSVAAMRDFVASEVRPHVPAHAADALEALTPATYLGDAEALARSVREHMTAF